jgi:hypothetical protein
MNSGVEKQRRMELRRKLGYRAIPDWPVPKAQPHGGRYLIAHACFRCRCSFKVSPRPDRKAVCPKCSGPMFEMGRSFKAPPSRDKEQWLKVQALYAAGFRFFSYRSFSCAPLPRRLSEVEPFIQAHPQHPFRVAAPNPSVNPDALKR